MNPSYVTFNQKGIAQININKKHLKINSIMTLWWFAAVSSLYTQLFEVTERGCLTWLVLTLCWVRLYCSVSLVVAILAG